MIPKQELIAYAESLSTPERDLLAQLNRETNLTQIYPRMLAGPFQGTFLRFVSWMIRPGKVLEIGTFTGYSMICLAEGGGDIHTIEVNPELEYVIRRYIKEAGLEKRVTLHIGDAATIIPTLEEKWDLIYLDADKPNYLTYYHLLIDRLRPGGWLLADNAFWDGKVLLPEEKMDHETRGVAKFNTFVRNDPRVETLLLPIRDGVMIVHKI